MGYQRIGISPAWLLGLLAISLLGSAVNLPVVRLPAEIIRTARIVAVFGAPYLIPGWRNGRARWWRSTSAAPSCRPAWLAT